MSGMLVSLAVNPFQLYPKYTGESKIASLDFSNMLAVGETLTSVQGVVVCVAQGTDPNPNNLISGQPTIVGNVVNQMITGGVANTLYTLSISVMTSKSQILTGVVQFPVISAC